MFALIVLKLLVAACYIAAADNETESTFAALGYPAVIYAKNCSYHGGALEEDPRILIIYLLFFTVSD